MAAAEELHHEDRAGRLLSPVRASAPPPELCDPARLPTEQMRALLAFYKRRGTVFDVAWDSAMAAIGWPVSRRDASEWRRGLEGTREGWRASFEDWPPEPRELAVGELGRILTDELRHAAA